MMIGVLHQAALGIQQNQRRFEQAADDIVRSTTSGADESASAGDLAGAAVRLLTARRGLEACLAVARTGDELLGTVIDTLA